jgi:hypothetical protein
MSSHLLWKCCLWAPCCLSVSLGSWSLYNKSHSDSSGGSSHPTPLWKGILLHCDSGHLFPSVNLLGVEQRRSHPFPCCLSFKKLDTKVSGWQPCPPALKAALLLAQNVSKLIFGCSLSSDDTGSNTSHYTRASTLSPSKPQLSSCLPRTSWHPHLIPAFLSTLYIPFKATTRNHFFPESFETLTYEKPQLCFPLCHILTSWFIDRSATLSSIGSYQVGCVIFFYDMAKESVPLPPGNDTALPFGCLCSWPFISVPFLSVSVGRILCTWIPLVHIIERLPFSLNHST